MILSQRVTFQASLAATFHDTNALQQKLGDIELREDLRLWLSRLMLLKGVPFSYLVPDETMLPPESIRFFLLDPNWIDALVDGAFSLGRNLTTTPAAANMNLDRALLPAVKAQAARKITALRANALGQMPLTPILKTVSGFLLRSTLVSHYPLLGVNAYPPGKTPDDGAAAMKRLDILRLETLGPNSDTLLCLLDGDACQVDIHEAPEHLHYGIDSYHYEEANKTVTAEKVVRTFTTKVVSTPKTKETQVTLDGKTAPLDLKAAFRSGSPRVLKMSAVAAQIAAANNIATVDAAEMGFEMTQGVGMVSFRKEKVSP